MLIKSKVTLYALVAPLAGITCEMDQILPCDWLTKRERIGAILPAQDYRLCPTTKVSLNSK